MKTNIKWALIWAIVYFVPMFGNHFIKPWSLYEHDPLWVDFLWWVAFVTVTTCAMRHPTITGASRPK